MKILFINSNGNGAYLPYVPPNFEISGSANFEEVATLDGVLNVPNNRVLRQFSIDSIFPIRQTSWTSREANMEGYEYVDFFNSAMENLEQCKVYIVDNNGYTVLYMKCCIESFSYSVDRVGDINYSMTVKEYNSISDLKARKL